MPRQKRNNSPKTKKRDEQDGRVTNLDFAAAPRAAQALRLRRLGYTYSAIAEMTGYSNEQNAWRAVKNASKKIVRDEARELVGYQLDMIDAALQVVCGRIARNDENSLWAVDRLVPLLKRQSELMGLDAPKAENVNAQQMTLVAVEAPILEAI